MTDTHALGDHFAGLALAWTRLADELEQTQALLNRIEAHFPKKLVG